MKKTILTIAAILILVFLFYAFFVKTVHKKEIIVNEPFSKISPQLSDIKNISKWYLPFASADIEKLVFKDNNKAVLGSDTIVLDKIDEGGNWIKATTRDGTAMLLFNFSPDTGKATKVSLEYENTLVNELIKGNSIIENAKKSLANLNPYFLDSKKMYGYNIEISTVTDTAFLFTSQVVAISEKKKFITILFEKLITRSGKNKNEYNGTRIFYSSPIANDSIHLFAGIGITNTQQVDITGDISLKRMPFKMNLLHTFYQGSFSKMNEPIEALGKFKEDNNLVSMAIPFIKFKTDGIEFADDQIIQAIACYPVF